MRHLIPALVVTVACLSTARAAPEKTSPFSTKSLGEGGGYKHPDADVGQFFETKPPKTEEPAGHEPEKPVGLKPERPRAPAKATPEIRPVAAVPSRPRPRPFAAPPAPAAPARDGAAQGAAAAGAPALDSASEDARLDYESRMLGAAPGPRRPGLADRAPEPAAETAAPPPAAPGEGMLFVSLELDSRESGSLRDAVAGLGESAAFKPDARFQPTPGAGGTVRVSGWLPASRLGDAIARPGVKRVAVERGARPAGDDRVAGEFLVTLRVSDPARPDESVAESVRSLSTETGFKLGRVLGFETVPGGGSTALVSGTMPVAKLSRALGLPGVVKVGSAGAASSSAETASAADGGVPRMEGFLRFVMSRAMWLVLLTALLALPTIGDAVKAGLSVFIPYR